jgi:hypothetical protein
MTIKMRILYGVGVLLLLASGGMMVREEPSSQAQGQTKNSKSKKDDKASVKAIDIRAEEVQESFIRDSVKLARDYEDAGLLEKSKQVLETIVKLKDDLPGLKDKIKTLDEELLSANNAEVEIDASKGWGNPIGQVYKNQTVRFQASGSYRLVTNLNLDATGFSNRDPITDLAEGVPLGALIGMVVDKDKKTEIFLVSSATDYSPKMDGILFLKINLPLGHKSSGKLKVKISGNIETR